MPQHFTKDQFAKAYSTAPLAVRNAMQSNETVSVVKNIRDTYHLHVDTISDISGQIGYMLLGLLTPSDFYKNLQGMGLDPKDATAITQEINAKIFQPLQQRIRDKVEEPVEEEEVEAEYDPSLAESYSNSRTVSSPPQVPVMRVASVSTQPTQEPTPSTAPAYNLIQNTPPSPITPTAAPVMRTMQHDMEMVESGHIPDPYTIQRAATPIPHPSQTTPARAFQTSSIPVTAPQAPQPVPMPSQPIVREIPQVTQPATPVPAAPTAVPSSDPYREPI